ncbi:MAG TPA: ATPase, partial [Verrucomicrobiales bacterium]|nr:ATPase [Verrucomicrobiales bacterium]
MNRDEIDAANQQVIEAGSFVKPLLEETGKVIVGQSYLMER